MKIRPVGAQTFGRTDGQADMTKLAVDFRNFPNTPKNDNPVPNLPEVRQMYSFVSLTYVEIPFTLGMTITRFPFARQRLDA